MSKMISVDLELSQIERQFDRAASSYDSVASLQRKMANRLLAQAPASLPAGVVDLGCGTGDLLNKLAHRTATTALTGVDLSRAMLDQAKQRVPQATLIRGDLASVPLESDSFELAVSNAAIQWCDADTVFAEIRRILRPGGQALISTFGPATMRQWRSALSAADGGRQRVHSFQTLAELASGLERAGFATVETELESINIPFDSVREMFESIRKLGATNARRDRPSGLSGRSWLNRVTQELEKSRDRDGKLNLTYECYYLFAS